MGYPYGREDRVSGNPTLDAQGKNGSLVNFIQFYTYYVVIVSDIIVGVKKLFVVITYLVAERLKVNSVSIVFTAGLVLHICAWTILCMGH